MKTNPSTILSTSRLAAGRWFVASVLLWAAGLRAAEPTFENVTDTIAPGLVEGSSVAWGDYDNDGRLDFLQSGLGHTTNGHSGSSFLTCQLWRNTGSGFTNVTATVAPGLLGVGGSVAWGDYDNDGRLDFFLTGSGIWRNTGNGFTNVTAAIAPGLEQTSVMAWGDYDNDGRLDILATGHYYVNGNYAPATQVWRNTGSGFTNVTATVAPGLPGVGYGSVAWGDYDNDGRLDFLLTGMTRHEAVPETDDQYIIESVSQLWRNTGNGFMNVTASVVPDLPAVYDSWVAWGDYDNDGRLDFLLTGSGISQVWRNTGSGFSNVTATVAPGLPGVNGSRVAWGDYDNDGRLDFLITGYGPLSQLWRNTGSGFTNVTASVAPDLPSLVHSSIAWGDYDNDGRLDFLVAGAKGFGCDGCDAPGLLSQLWRNNTVQANPPPAAITGQPTGVSQTGVVLNARINPRGQAANGWFFWGDSTNYGHLTAAQPMGNGSSFSNFSQTITGLSTGVTYYYRAVGSNVQGQVFLGFEQQFLLAVPGVTTSPAGNVSPNAATFNGQANPNSLPGYGWFEWGLTPAYGQVTPVQLLGSGLNTPFSENIFGLVAGSTYYFRAVASNSLGVVYGAQQSLVMPTFVNVTAGVAPGLPGVWGSVAWGDFDNDGRPDFLITGYYLYAWNWDRYVSQLWRNTGSGFENVTATVAPGLPGVWSSSATWGDYDNDGRLDLLLTGSDDIDRASGISQVWRNTGSGFTNVTAAVASGLPQLANSSVAWGDYDNDGRLDFLITGSFYYEGEEASYNIYVSQLWRNTGQGFTNVTATVAPGLPQVGFGSVAWGDYDNDGRLDFLITGTTNGGINSSESIAQLWRNTGSGFTNVTAGAAPGLPGFGQSSGAWGDYDNDGRLDFVVTGVTNDGFGLRGSLAQLWRNAGSGFENVTATVAPGLRGIAAGQVVWGDYDNDGRLDLLFSGVFDENFSDEYISELWRNTGNGFENVTASATPNLPGLSGSSLAWGDYDNDGRLDFLLNGNVDDNYISQLWRNYTPLTNTPPSAPTGLAMTATTNAVMLSWNSATDGQTPASGLTYNVRAGTTPGGMDLLSAHVDATNGSRRVPALGNAMLRHSLPLTGLTNVTNGQTVYWSVQAVDTSFAGGPFATETSVVSIPQLTITPISGTHAIVSWAPPTFGWLLQQSTNLSVSIWTTTPGGNANPATVPATNEAQFYRLSKP